MSRTTELEKAILADFERMLSKQARNERRYIKRLARQFYIPVDAAAQLVTLGRVVRGRVAPLRKAINALKSVFREQRRKSK